MDHYQTLGLTSAATKDEIKEAFRRSALKFHPDRHSNSSPEIQKNASLRFRLASEAYEILADDRRRTEYDLRRRAGWGPSANYGAPRYGYGGGGGYRRQTAGAGFDGGFMFQYLTGRRFLANLAFASALFGASVVIQKSGEAIWKMNNSGISSQEGIDARLSRSSFMHCGCFHRTAAVRRDDIPSCVISTHAVL